MDPTQTIGISLFMAEFFFVQKAPKHGERPRATEHVFRSPYLYGFGSDLFKAPTFRSLAFDC